MNRSYRFKKRQQERNNLIRKYQALFKNMLKFKGLEYGVSSFLMTKLLHQGQIAAVKSKTSKHVEPVLLFVDFATHEYDWKNDPIWIRPINVHLSPLIPEKLLKNNEEAVVIRLDFIPQMFITEYVDRITDIRATIRMNLNAHKTPFIIKSNDKKTINGIRNILINEELVSVDDTMFEILDTKVPYIIDKLYIYEKEVEAELLDILGIDNMKADKKAQMTVDEVNVNEDEIDAYRRALRDKLESAFEQIREVLGFNVSLEKDPDEMEGRSDNDDDETL